VGAGSERAEQAIGNRGGESRAAAKREEEREGSAQEGHRDHSPGSTAGEAALVAEEREAPGSVHWPTRSTVKRPKQLEQQQQEAVEQKVVKVFRGRWRSRRLERFANARASRAPSAAPL